MNHTVKHNEPAARFRVEVDVGGTFTDVVLVEEGSGRILVAKVHTVPADPSQGCIAGIDKVLKEFSLDPGQISFVVHGTTIATNTIIEGKGAKAGLITSEGFRDVLEIAYQTRPNLYDIFYDKVKPLIPRYLSLGVPERIGPDGTVRVPLNEAALRAVAARLMTEGVESIAVAFLHSYRDPTHERLAGKILAEACGGIPIVLSSDVCPEFREYPRTSTAVVNAVLLPRITPYVARLEDRLRERGIMPALHLMTSAGGIMAADTAKRLPVHLVESGPAAGVIGAAFVAELSGFGNLLALDIGGTTAKAALVSNGKPQIAEQFEVGAAAIANVTSPKGQGYPVLTPVISLVEIGAGGGSIAQVDPGGALSVGPQSAGAVPGPACYGMGGEFATLTDANVVLGRIDPDYFLGGAVKLDRGLAEKAIREKVAEPAGLGVIQAAQAVLEIANAKMTSALYFISVEQGIDPRDYVLVPSGGAGPLQAVAIGMALGVRTVLIPPTPGLNSAVGLLASDLKHDVVRTYMKTQVTADPNELSAIYAEMELSVQTLLKAEGVAQADISITREIEMCYVGQSFRLKMPVPNQIAGSTLAALTEAFHEEHARAYGFANLGEPTQLVNLRLNGTGLVKRPILRRLPPATDSIARAIKRRRHVYFDYREPAIEVEVYDRDKLRAGDKFAGPAIVEQMDTTVVLPPGVQATVEDIGSIVISTGVGRESRLGRDSRIGQEADMTTSLAAKRQLNSKIDPVSFEVIRNALLNITEEMALTIRRAAYSTNIKTRADFSCAFFDASARCVAQSFAQPAHLVSMASIVPVSIREIGAENMKPGNSYVVNDAHRGTSHLNDITVISPVDVDGYRVGYLANMAHHVDVGGSAPASLGVSREIFQEGIILPPTRVAAEGKIDANVLNLILANIRAPRETNGDLRAQMSANVVGARRLGALFNRYSAAMLEEFYDELISYTERWTESEIRKLPEGIYEAEGFRDDDGFTDEPVRLKARITIRDGHVHLDVSGSSEQRPSPMNCTRSMALCTVAFVTRCLVDDRVPVNDGFLSRIHLDGPDGLVCTAMRPGAVVGGWELAARLAEVVLLALHPALPKCIPAAGKGLIVNIGFGGVDPRTKEYYCYMETIAGGNGARPTKDGPDAVQTNLQNTENAPIEEVELNYPILITRYELIQDSCGAGRFRGGLGVLREFEFPYAGTTCTILSDGRKFAPWGLAGGDSAQPARFTFDPAGEKRELKSKCTVDIPRGGCVRVETPGGGGFGPYGQRTAEATARDLRDEKVSDAWIQAAGHA